MISRVIKKTVDLDVAQKVDQLDGPLYQLEESGHTFEITCMSGGTEAAVSGTVSGRFLRADETTVYFTGTLSGNVASITLPQSCYNVSGRFGFVVFISGNNVTSAIYAVAGNVYRSTSETIIDPTGEIPSLEELIAQIEACENATDDALAAAAFVPNMLAKTFIASAVYSPGDYVVYDGDGKLYMITAAHAKNTVWADTSKEEVLTVDEISRAFSDIEELQSLNSGEIVPFIRGGYINTNPSSGVISTTPTASGVWQYAVIDCAENNTFTITGDTSGSNTNHYLWLFLKSDFTRLTHATAGDVEKDLVLTAPENAAYLVVNAKIGYPAFLCKGNSVQKQITNLGTSVTNLGTSVTSLGESVTALEPSLRYRSQLSASMDIHDLESGLYRKTTGATPLNWPSTFPDGYDSNTGLLVSFKWGTNYRALLYFPAKSTNRPNSAVFYQITSNTAWTEWRMLNTNQPGDSTDLNELASQYKNGSGKFDTTFSLEFRVGRDPIVLGMTAQYTGTTAPTVVYSIGNGTTAAYTSPAYDLGDTLQSVTKEWRVPPAVCANNICTVTVTIPSGTVADITDMYTRQDAVNKPFDGGIWWQGHSGWMSLFPRDSIAGFQYGAKLGFNAMVTIPKFTSDLVGVCFHDETSITIDGVSNPISGWTYEQLKAYDIGGGMRVPTLDDFFRICANCNMAPILSVHTSSSYKEFWLEETGKDRFQRIKLISDKYGLTKKLWIKCGQPNVLDAAYTVFGADFGGVILLANANSSWGPLAQAKNINNEDGDKYIPANATSVKEAVAPIMYEMFYSKTYIDNITSKFASARAADCKCSIAYNSGALSGATMKQLIGIGATGFCQDRHCSMGLDW